jgi:hypothetical protein
MRNLVLLAALGVLLAAGDAVFAGPPAAQVKLVLENHRFTPATADVPAGQRIRIELVNHDGTSEEFDSDDLHAEQVVDAHGKAVFQVGPLTPGTYHFMGEMHAATATGELHAVAAPAQ